jgi:hypothetical protein
MNKESPMGSEHGSRSRSTKHRQKRKEAKSNNADIRLRRTAGDGNPSVVVLLGTTSSTATAVDEIHVPRLGMPAVGQLHVQLPARPEHAVHVQEVRCERGPTSNAVLTTATESGSPATKGMMAVGRNSSSPERCPLPTVNGITIQSPRVVEDQGVRSDVPQRRSAASSCPHRGTWKCNGRRRLPEDEEPFVLHEEPSGERRRAEEENVGTTTLQRLHTLVQALNPHERQIFLRMHTLVSEFRETEEEESHRENGKGIEEVDGTSGGGGTVSRNWRTT